MAVPPQQRDSSQPNMQQLKVKLESGSLYLQYDPKRASLLGDNGGKTATCWKFVVVELVYDLKPPSENQPPHQKLKRCQSYHVNPQSPRILELANTRQK